MQSADFLVFGVAALSVCLLLTSLLGLLYLRFFCCHFRLILVSNVLVKLQAPAKDFCFTLPLSRLFFFLEGNVCIKHVRAK